MIISRDMIGIHDKKGKKKKKQKQKTRTLLMGATDLW